MVTVKIKQFQSIKQPIEILLQGFTVITGESNIGKSAIIRAIKAAFSNKEGRDFITVGSNECEVIIDNINAHLLRWKKGTSALYEIDGQKYEKIGRGSLPEVMKALGVAEIRTSDKQKHWPQIQMQLDGLYILGESSPNTVAELLGATDETNLVSIAIKLAQADAKEAKVKETILSSQAGSLKQRISLLERETPKLWETERAMDWLKATRQISKKATESLTNLERDWNLKQKEISSLLWLINTSIPKPPPSLPYQKLHDQYSRWIRNQTALKVSIPKPPTIPDQKLRERVQKLLFLTGRFNQLSVEIASGQRLGGMKIPVRGQFQETEKRIHVLEDLQERYEITSNEISDNESRRNEVETTLRTLDRKRANLREKVALLEVCPLCDAPISEGKFREPADLLRGKEGRSTL